MTPDKKSTIILVRDNACVLRNVGFFMDEISGKIVNEEEYEDYMRAVFGLHEYVHEHDPLQEPLRDEFGHQVPGCYRTIPANPD